MISSKPPTLPRRGADWGWILSSFTASLHLAAYGVERRGEDGRQWIPHLVEFRLENSRMLLAKECRG